MSSYRTNKATTKDLGALQTDTRTKIAQVLSNLNPNIKEAKDAAQEKKRKDALPKSFDDWMDNKSNLKSGYFGLSQKEQIDALGRINEIGKSLLNVIDKSDAQRARHGGGRVAEVEENIIFKDFLEYKKLMQPDFETEAFYTKEVFTEFVNFHARLQGMLGGAQ